MRSELCNDDSVSDIDVLPTGFWETSFGIDLCIGAMSTDLVNLLILASAQMNILTRSLLLGAIVTLITEIFFAVVITYFFRQWDGNSKYWKRVLIIQLTNVTGLAAMFFSFYILGYLLIQ